MIECCTCSLDIGTLSVKSVSVRQVFSEDHYRDCSETIEFWSISGLVPIHIESIVATICKHFPLNPEFNYLKRIHNSTILISPDGEGLEERLDSLLTSLQGRNLIAETTRIGKISVPKYSVLTRNQYETANAIWPVRVTTPLVDIDQDLDDIQKEKVLSRFQMLSDNHGQCLLESPDGVVSVVGKGADAASAFHFRHSVLDAADQVGKLSEYLATDYVAYLGGEPCIMCSMALLHSRVKEVFYLFDSEPRSFHGFGSTVSVHCQKKLNHRFSVFRVTSCDHSRFS